MQTKLHLDRSEKLIIAESMQDCEEILKVNHYLRGEAQKSDVMRHVARIPNVILVKWANEEWARGNTQLRMFSKEFDELVARKLRDPEWRYLRVDK